MNGEDDTALPNRAVYQMSLSPSTFYHTLYTCILVMVLFVGTTMAAPPTYYSMPAVKLLFSKRQPVTVTDCDSDQAVSLICYQCGKTHSKEFTQIYGSCCRGQEDLERVLREYCMDIFREPPKRGGLWA